MTIRQGQPERVAYILKMFPRFSETFILSEVLELERLGVDVRIFSLKEPLDGRRHADVDRVRAKVTHVPMGRIQNLGRLLWPHGRLIRNRPLAYARTLWHLARRRRIGAVKRFLQAGYIAPHLQAEGITHIHAHFASSATSVAHFIYRLTGIDYSFTAHAKDIFIDSVSQDVLKRKLAAAQFVVTVSDYNRSHLQLLENIVPIERIYNGLDLNQFVQIRAMPETIPLILGVGRLVEKKGFDDLIRACALLRDQGRAFRCRIVGSGPEEDRLEALIEDLGLGELVSLDGPMPREELIELYPRASLFVAPCIIGADGNRDGLPTVLIEAMALGVPVISTPVTGIPELVRHDETGLLVPPSDPDALAAAMVSSLDDPVRSRERATAGRLLVEQHFNLEQNVSNLRDLFLKAS